MKHPLHYLRPIFFILLLITAISCEKEELTEEPLSSDVTETIQPEVKISTKSLAQFIEEDAKFKRSYSKFTSKRKGVQLKEGSDFEVNPSKVIKVEDSEKTTYTVAITKEDTPVGTFENLVIDVDEDETMQTYILSYIPDANGIVEFTNDSVSFKGTMTVAPIDYDASDLLSQRITVIYITIMFCDVWGTTHLANSGCTGPYPVTFAIPIGSSGSNAASQNNNGIVIVGNQNMPDPNFGGGGSMGGGTTSVPIMGDDENIIKKRDAVIEALKLHPGQKSWVNNNENNEDVKAIFKFLGENFFSDESTDFAKEAFEALRDDGEVDWDEKIIKDESFKDTKADCVLNELISTNNNLFKKISEAFTNENSEYKIRFSIINNPNDLAEARTSLPNNKGIIDIKLNQSQTSTLSAIDLARIIIHETIHAELHRIKLSNNSGPNPLPSERFNWYITMWEYYEDYYNGNTNRAATASEHTYMAYYYINPIANGLREFDNNSHPVNNYKYLAWTGLQQYGKNANYISEEELMNLANLTNIIYSDSHKNNCDN